MHILVSNVLISWSAGSEWRWMKKLSKNLQHFIATQLRPPMDKVKTMTLETILEAVRCEKLFGCIECDIHAPEHLCVFEYRTHFGKGQCFNYSIRYMICK